MAMSQAKMRILGLLVVVGALHQVAAFTCPNILSQAWIAHPTDCQKYYHCLTDGRFFLKSCPPGLVFEPNNKICIWDSTSTSCIENQRQIAKDNAISSQIPIIAKKAALKDTRYRRPTTRRATTAAATTTTTTTTTVKPTTTMKKMISTTIKALMLNTNSKMGVTSRNDGTSVTSQEEPEGDNSNSFPADSLTTDYVLSTELGSEEMPRESEEDMGDNLDFSNESSESTEEPESKLSTEKVKDLLPRRRDSGLTLSIKDKPTPIELSASASLAAGQHIVYRRQISENSIEDSNKPPTIPKVTCSSAFAYVVDPSNCDTFYHCNNWRPFEKRCPPGLYFDFDNLVCNWPHNVNCVEGYRAKTYFAFSYRRRHRPHSQNFVIKPRAPKTMAPKVDLETQPPVEEFTSTTMIPEVETTIVEETTTPMEDTTTATGRIPFLETVESDVTRMKPNQENDKTESVFPEMSETYKTTPAMDDFAETQMTGFEKTSRQPTESVTTGLIRSIWDAMTGGTSSPKTSQPDDKVEEGDNDRQPGYHFTANIGNNNTDINATANGHDFTVSPIHDDSTKYFEYESTLMKKSGSTPVRNDAPIPHSYFIGDRYAEDQRSVYARDYPNVEDVEIEKFMLKILNDAIKEKHVESRDISEAQDNLVDGTFKESDDVKKGDQTLDEMNGDSWLLMKDTKQDFKATGKFVKPNEDDYESSGDIESLYNENSEKTLTGIIMKDEAIPTKPNKDSTQKKADSDNVIAVDGTDEKQYSKTENATNVTTQTADNTTPSTAAPEDDNTTLATQTNVTETDTNSTTTMFTTEANSTVEPDVTTTNTVHPIVSSESDDSTNSTELNSTSANATEADTSSSNPAELDVTTTESTISDNSPVNSTKLDEPTKYVANDEGMINETEKSSNTEDNNVTTVTESSETVSTESSDPPQTDLTEAPNATSSTVSVNVSETPTNTAVETTAVESTDVTPKNETQTTGNETKVETNETKAPVNATEKTRNETEIAENEAQTPKNESEIEKSETENQKNETEVFQDETVSVVDATAVKSEDNTTVDVVTTRVDSNVSVDAVPMSSDIVSKVNTTNETSSESKNQNSNVSTSKTVNGSEIVNGSTTVSVLTDSDTTNATEVTESSTPITTELPKQNATVPQSEQTNTTGVTENNTTYTKTDATTTSTTVSQTTSTTTASQNLTKEAELETDAPIEAVVLVNVTHIDLDNVTMENENETAPITQDDAVISASDTEITNSTADESSDAESSTPKPSISTADLNIASSSELTSNSSSSSSVVSTETDSSLKAVEDESDISVDMSSTETVTTEIASSPSNADDTTSEVPSTVNQVSEADSTEMMAAASGEQGFEELTSIPPTENTKGTKKSFISLSDLIKWYLRHWRHYSRWRESREVQNSVQ